MASVDAFFYGLPIRTKTQSKTRKRPQQPQRAGLRDKIQNRTKFGVIVFAAICVLGFICIGIKVIQFKNAIVASPLMEGFTSSAAMSKATELMFADHSKLSQQEKKELGRKIAMLMAMSGIESDLPWGSSYLFQIDSSELKKIHRWRSTASK